ncbi:hypothetical protein COCC4DRAFT_59258 [Bipolaris maydis ATCC 48331]|uniref:Uncharacterized protein n=2 Tax=Cochliobolus heterostrophus TaxID=5016 RepID=M2TLM3_COCH5|nr:uncharacterized protein COCC4DRAFT_59258 [Bipolaris maydis ATCC 48331]EMD87389.1 hypothetical protein COCHEDRAFT_1033815 [Bipolaris maydis C5]KAH7554788.1 hypothetical protein BM1_07449 [Bipolaris maydis]ENI06588.1 hypothetical protein COCC4DRAFT_59258 [Bipolaris maydis ATCC 48331]KAJ5023319.1 hypothetical protein J3E73DRAFT_400823 [Bipolaris maydis]KAJ5041477.1 hypothetical protein J3E74DRAFT_450148 [Bipolaris maydis]
MPYSTDPYSTSTTNTTQNNAAEAQKSRTNSDIINLFKAPPTPTTKPSIKGIGLYTHIAAPINPSATPHPVFLPITQTSAGKDPSNPTLPEEVRNLCSDLRDLIHDEEAAVAKRELNFEELTKRYAGLPVPSDEMALVAREQGDVVMKEDEVGQRGTEREAGMQSASRRLSADVAGSGGREDVVMRGQEEETVSRLPPGTHIYREDPRRRR